jgi:hypothetical protein
LRPVKLEVRETNTHQISLMIYNAVRILWDQEISE